MSVVVEQQIWKQKCATLKMGAAVVASKSLPCSVQPPRWQDPLPATLLHLHRTAAPWPAEASAEQQQSTKAYITCTEHVDNKATRMAACKSTRLLRFMLLLVRAGCMAHNSWVTCAASVHLVVIIWVLLQGH